MYKGRDDSESIIALVKETADGFGHLIAEHVKLARLELVADAKASGRKVAVIALIVPVLFIGYGLAAVGLAVLLSRWLGTAGAFFAVGGAHVVLGGVAIAIAANRLHRMQSLRESVHEVNRSVEAITAAGVANGAPTTNLQVRG